MGFPRARALALACTVVASSAIRPSAAYAADVAQPHGGAQIVVDNCSDDGPGSLRAAVRDIAVSGDTIDLGQLACSTITLSSGAIVVDVDDLAIVGAGRARIAIDGAHRGRVIVHEGAGKLDLQRLTIANGKYANGVAARGGCIDSRGDVALSDAAVHDCLVAGTRARGGGVYATGTLALTDTTVSECTARADGANDVAQGGGVFTGADLLMVRSTLSSNDAYSQTGTGAMFGGGAYVHGQFAAKYSGIFDNATHAEAGYDSAGGVGVGGGATIVGSSFDGNSAMSSGGLVVRGGVGVEVTISNSTISRNLSRRGAGLSVGGPFTLSNSTITGNRTYFFGSNGGAGVFAGAAVTIESSIVANNLTTSGSPAFDIGGVASTTIAGSHNVIGLSRFAVPADTSSADPHLGPPIRRGTALAYPLLPGSQAIDAGSNPRFLQYDQRDDPFRRVVGADPDIGAYEFDPDRIFFDDFD